MYPTHKKNILALCEPQVSILENWKKICAEILVYYVYYIYALFPEKKSSTFSFTNSLHTHSFCDLRATIDKVFVT